MILRLGILRPDGDDGFHTAGTWHAHVHERDVRAMLPMQFYRLRAIRGFGHHIHIGLCVQNRLDAHARDQVVLRDQDANHLMGTFTSTSVPCPRRTVKFQFASQAFRALAHSQQAEVAADFREGVGLLEALAVVAYR